VKKTIMGVTFLFLIFFSTNVIAACSDSTSISEIGEWKGYVRFSNGTNVADGSPLTAHINNASTIDSTIGIGDDITNDVGEFSITVCSATGNNVSFKVWDLWTDLVDQAWSPGRHKNSSDSYGFYHLKVAQIATGQTCSYTQTCSSGFCADGYCCDTACAATNYDCNVAGALGTCTSTGTTTTECTTSSSSGGGGLGGGAAAVSCTAGTKRCSGDNLQECSENGDAWTTTEECENGCDSDALACKVIAVTPEPEPEPKSVTDSTPEPIPVDKNEWAEELGCVDSASCVEKMHAEIKDEAEVMEFDDWLNDHPEYAWMDETTKKSKYADYLWEIKKKLLPTPPDEKGIPEFVWLILLIVVIGGWFYHRRKLKGKSTPIRIFKEKSFKPQIKKQKYKFKSKKKK